jgi:DNA-binding NtrC family response regulator
LYDTPDPFNTERPHPTDEVRAVLEILAWVGEPDRVGEVLAPPLRGEGVFGRAEPGWTPLTPRRPGDDHPGAPVTSSRLSRRQLAISRRDGGVAVTSLGRRALLVGGRAVETAVLLPGDTAEIAGELLLRCAVRRWDPPSDDHPFGRADAAGLVGESDAARALRARVTRLARLSDHVLILGPTGSGKELVARALHAGSPRADGPWVARNASTLPPGLAAAELFGHARDYPNAGMPERPGLVGAAHGGVLFLDEIGDLPPDVQPQLLRLLDEGQHQRLGDARARTADLRVIGATSRPLEDLRPDLVARMTLRVVVPGLDARPADLPLIAAHLLRDLARQDPSVNRVLSPAGMPRLAPSLVQAWLRAPWPTHVRGLRAALWDCLDASPGDVLREPAPLDGPALVTEADRLRAALDRCGGVQEQAWRELGLSSRHQLTRLLRRHGVHIKRTVGVDPE